MQGDELDDSLESFFTDPIFREFFRGSRLGPMARYGIEMKTETTPLELARTEGHCIGCYGNYFNRKTGRRLGYSAPCSCPCHSPFLKTQEEFKSLDGKRYYYKVEEKPEIKGE